MGQIRASASAWGRLCRADKPATLLHCGLLCVLASLLMAGPSTAYPSRAVTVIVPFAAGGPTDKVARIITGYLATTLGQQFIIENVVGSGGGTAAIRAMRAPADGYTLIMGQMGTHGSAPAVYPQLAYDPVNDFAPIGLVVEMPIVVITSRRLPVQTLPELIAHLHQHPQTTMAHAGAGSISYASCTLLASINRFHSAAKSFQGTGPALRALLDGRVDYICDQIVNSIDRLQTGELRALAVSANARSPALPDVPTAAEAGVPGFNITAWHALFAPRNTPATLIVRLNTILGQALDDDSVRRQLTDLAGDIPQAERRTPAALDRLVREEVVRWKQHLKQAPQSDGQRAWQ